jgi:hypothetical protein
MGEMVSERNASLASICWVTAASVAAFLCFLQLGAMASQLAARTGFALIAPIALTAALLVAYGLALREGLPPRQCWYPGVLTLILLAASLLLSAFFMISPGTDSGITSQAS